MAVKLKANISYQPIVESVSRKFVPVKETCKAAGEAGPVAYESTGWMGGAVRKTGRAGLGACTKNYLVIRTNARMTQPSSSELDNREMFGRAIKGRNHIVHDLSQISAIQLLWKTANEDNTKTINGVYAYGYTFFGWVMAVQFAGIKDAAEAGTTYNENQFPQGFDA